MPKAIQKRITAPIGRCGKDRGIPENGRQSQEKGDDECHNSRIPWPAIMRGPAMKPRRELSLIVAVRSGPGIRAPDSPVYKRRAKNGEEAGQCKCPDLFLMVGRFKQYMHGRKADASEVMGVESSNNKNTTTNKIRPAGHGEARGFS